MFTVFYLLKFLVIFNPKLLMLKNTCRTLLYNNYPLYIYIKLNGFIWVFHFITVSYLLLYVTTTIIFFLLIYCLLYIFIGWDVNVRMYIYTLTKIQN